MSAAPVVYTCEWCKRSFASKVDFEIHLCLPKRLDPTPPATVEDFDHGDDDGSPGT